MPPPAPPAEPRAPTPPLPPQPPPLPPSLHSLPYRPPYDQAAFDVAHDQAVFDTQSNDVAPTFTFAAQSGEERTQLGLESSTTTSRSAGNATTSQSSRICSQLLNVRHRTARSRFRGVAYDGDAGMWSATLLNATAWHAHSPGVGERSDERASGSLFLGYYEDEKEAARAVDVATARAFPPTHVMLRRLNVLTPSRAIALAEMDKIEHGGDRRRSSREVGYLARILSKGHWGNDRERERILSKGHEGTGVPVLNRPVGGGTLTSPLGSARGAFKRVTTHGSKFSESSRVVSSILEAKEHEAREGKESASTTPSIHKQWSDFLCWCV